MEKENYGVPIIGDTQNVSRHYRSAYTTQGVLKISLKHEITTVKTIFSLELHDFDSKPSR